MTAFCTPAEAPIYNAVTGMSWAVGCILGPVIGGAFSVSDTTWRWARLSSALMFLLEANAN